MPTGRVSFFNEVRGFGFIEPDEIGPDVFVHISTVEEIGLTTLQPGQRVQYELRPSKGGKGPSAINLVLI